MKKLLNFIITNIVNHPKSVKIEKIAAENGLNTYRIGVHPDDLGQVIGRQGKIIKAIRKIAFVLALEKKEKVNIQLIETDKSR